jgi:4-hydroxybenzoate polyprenyltransferase
MIYIVIQIFYSFYFRHVIILDSLIVAAGFILRVFAGGIASYSSVSSWLLLTTVGLSLLLAFGKRRSEKTILAQHQSPQESGTRATLRHYPDSLLDSMISTSASFCLITYSLFTFQISPQGTRGEIARFLPSILSTPKWMMVTIPIVIYGVARYLYVIYEKKDAESPERVLLSDKPLLATVVLWVVAVLSILYLLPKLFSAI